MERKLKAYTIRGLVRTQNTIILILNAIKNVLRHLEWIFIIVCLVGVWHYFCVFYPRFTTIDAHNTYYKNLGIDYWGIIVGFLTLLVTLLVGWNIYSTIKAKDDLNEQKKKLDDEVESTKKALKHQYSNIFDDVIVRLSQLEKCCTEKSVKIATLNKRIDSEVMRVKADLLFANGLYAFEKGVKATKSLEKRVFSEAYKYFLDSLHIYVTIEPDTGEINKCCRYLDKCLFELENACQSFGEVTYNECLKTLGEILSSKDITLGDRTRRSLEGLKARQEDISFTSFEQAIYDYVFSVMKHNPSDEHKSGTSSKNDKTTGKAEATIKSSIFRRAGVAAETPLACMGTSVTAKLNLASKNTSKQKKERGSTPKSHKKGNGGTKKNGPK